MELPIYSGFKNTYNALVESEIFNPNALYICKDSGELFYGETLIGAAPDTTLSNRVTAMENLIPNQATADNELADKILHGIDKDITGDLARAFTDDIGFEMKLFLGRD